MHQARRIGITALAIAAVAATITLWTGATPAAAQVEQLVVYSGRSRSLVQPVIQRFEEETGIRVQVRYGQTAQLATTLREEGDRSPADVFWAQDAGSLGSLVRADRFDALPEALVEKVPAVYRNEDNRWVGTSGRARVLAFSPERVDEDEQMPESVFDLTDSKYEGRVGWAPANGSFQAFVTAMRHKHGDETTREWLTDMRDNGARSYSNNTSIVQAIAAGEVDFGLVNHYYLLRFLDDDADYPVDQTAFEAGDVGNLVLTSGVGLLKSARNRDAAERFIEYLLSDETQQYFIDETFEYPVIPDAEMPEGLRIDPAEQSERAPEIELDAIDDLEGTLELFRDVGLL